jgi:hypothetical protein
VVRTLLRLTTPTPAPHKAEGSTSPPVDEPEIKREAAGASPERQEQETTTKKLKKQGNGEARQRAAITPGLKAGECL